MDMNYVRRIDMDKAYRMLNIGSTVLVSSTYDGVDDVMPVSLVCNLSFSPFKVSVVINKNHKTRELIEKRKFFAISIPTKKILKETLSLGRISLTNFKDKIKYSGIRISKFGAIDVPFVEDCIGWMIFHVEDNPLAEKYNLLIGECVDAFSDYRVFDGHFHFDEVSDDFKTIHYVAGGHQFEIGDEIVVDEPKKETKKASSSNSNSLNRRISDWEKNEERVLDFIQEHYGIGASSYLNSVVKKYDLKTEDLKTISDVLKSGWWVVSHSGFNNADGFTVFLKKMTEKNRTMHAQIKYGFSKIDCDKYYDISLKFKPGIDTNNSSGDDLFWATQDFFELCFLLGIEKPTMKVVNSDSSECVRYMMSKDTLEC